MILEFGCNHNGDLNIATEMIDVAAILGVWGIKFQKRDVEGNKEKWKCVLRNPETSFGDNYYAHRKSLEFDLDVHRYLKEYAEDLGLTYMCTAFDKKSVDDLLSIGCEYIKLPSQLFSNKDGVRDYLLKKNVNTILSVGMHAQEEISENLEYMFKNRLYPNVVYHCVSMYPFNSGAARLSNLYLLNDWPITIGYSSHDINGDAIYSAVLCGAEWIERHFTLDKNMKGSDHSTVSSEPGEILSIMDAIESAEKILDPEVSFDELAIRKKYMGDI